MDNNTPNKIVKALHNEWLANKKTYIVDESNKAFWERQEKIKAELVKITTIEGAIEVLSKVNILRLCSMESSLRFMPLHSFLIYIQKACNDMLNIEDK